MKRTLTTQTAIGAGVGLSAVLFAGALVAWTPGPPPADRAAADRLAAAIERVCGPPQSVLAPHFDCIASKLEGSR